MKHHEEAEQALQRAVEVGFFDYLDPSAERKQLVEAAQKFIAPLFPENTLHNIQVWIEWCPDMTPTRAATRIRWKFAVGYRYEP